MGTWTPGPGATAGADTFTGDATNEVADGLGGDDTLNGAGGDDTLHGGDNSDTLHGGVGSDDLFGGAGDDIMLVQEGEDASGETYDGGDGTDMLLVAGSVNLIGATTSFERLTFIDGAFGVNAVAFGSASLPSTTLLVTGSADLDIVQVNVASGNLSLAGWTFSSWSANIDYVAIFGAADANTIVGTSGTDVLSGGDGADQLYGGLGWDQLSEGVADGDTDHMYGGDGNDNYGVFEAGDIVHENSGEGTDRVAAWMNYTLGVNVENVELYGTATIATGNGLGNGIVGNELDNTLSGLGGNDSISGGDGADNITGGAAADSIAAGNGNDIINYTIGDGADAVDGGADTDTFVITGNASDSILYARFVGGALIEAMGCTLSNVEGATANMLGGTDWLVFQISDAVEVNLATGYASGFGFGAISGVENVVGEIGNDNLFGNNVANRLDGGAGNDFIEGGGGADIVLGGEGHDTLAGGLAGDSVDGGAGNDGLVWNWGDGADTLNGGADADVVNATGTAADNIVRATYNGSVITNLFDNVLVNVEGVNVDMLGGTDWLVYTASADLVIDLGGTATGFTSVFGVENAIGGSGNDLIVGTAGANRLDGASGNDTLDGSLGADVIFGGDGADSIVGGAGNDSLQGGAGSDNFTWAWGDGRDTFNGGADGDILGVYGSAAENILRAAWNGSALTGVIDNAIVSVEAVHLDGQGGEDWLAYTASASVVVDLGAGTGSGFASVTAVENVVGGTGADTLTGNGSANKLLGGDGADVLTGGAGADTLTGGLSTDTFVYAAGAGADVVTDFDAVATGGQDLIDISAFGITSGDFGARVTITDLGSNTLVTIDGSVTVNLQNVTGDGDNVITSADFILA